jgi:hypothetical protein
LVSSVVKKVKLAGCWWLMPVILAAQEAEVVQGQPRQKSKTLSQKYPTPKKGWWIHSNNRVNSNPNTTQKKTTIIK